MKNKLTETVDNVLDFAKKNEPAILTGMGVAGLFITTFMAFKAGPKAEEILNKHRKEIDENSKNGMIDSTVRRDITVNTIKSLSPVVLPTIGMAVATSACIIGSNTVSSKRIAVLSAAYTMSSDALKDYQAKVIEMVDGKKVQKIKESIAKDKLDKNADNIPGPGFIVAGTGDVLCMDCYSGRYFRSNAQKIGQAINELSSDLQTDMYVSLNDFYDKINTPDLPHVPMGDDFGWNVDDLARGQLSIDISAQLTPDQQPCLVVVYDVSPREDFRRLH